MILTTIRSASAINGMRHTRAASIQMFKHNDMKSFKDVLQKVKTLFPDVREGRRSVFIAIESLYSMDGDYSPVHQVLSAAKEYFPLGNIVFCIDEAHTSGIIGPNGSGFICHYGLEHEFAIRIHSKCPRRTYFSAVAISTNTFDPSSIRQLLMLESS
jgi:8-amino-7-oxononanoate synthase